MELADSLFWLITVVSFLLTAVAVRIGLNFDLNKYLETRREHQKEKLRILCPHAQIVEKNGEPFVIPTFETPSGTHNWICQRCGMESLGSGPFDIKMESYRRNPKLILLAEKQFQKFAKKVYKL